MRVAQVIDALRLAGGAERLQRTLAEALASHDVALTIVTLGPDDRASVREMEALGARVVSFPARRFVSPRRALALRRFLDEERFDAIHTHLVRSTVLGAAAARSVGTPVVATIHNSKRNPALPRTLLALESHALRRWVDRVLAVGWETAAAHRSRLPDVPIEVLPNATPSPEPISPDDRRKVRDELGVADDECLVVAVGRLARAKNLPLLVDAFARLRERAPSAQLRIVGEGELRPRIERRIAEQGLAPHAALLGLRRDVDRILASSDVYVSASIYEGLPLATLEAMHAALPVVATRVGDVPHVVTPETGRLVESGDRAALVRELEALVADESMRRRLGRAGRARAREAFGTARWAERHCEIYTELCGGADGGERHATARDERDDRDGHDDEVHACAS